VIISADRAIASQKFPSPYRALQKLPIALLPRQGLFKDRTGLSELKRQQLAAAGITI
jgi:hypothetical protein